MAGPVREAEAPAYRREVLTPDDARQLLDAFDGSRLWPLVAFSIGTGLRQGEQLALHWSEVDRAVVGDAWHDEDLVFPGPTGEIRSGSSLTHLFQQRLERRGVPVIRWHAMRRLCSALLQDQGVPITVVRDILGHSGLSVTDGYAYVMPAALLDAAETLDGALAPDLVRGRNGVRKFDESDELPDLPAR